jgi:hypothetical protein
VTVIVPALKVAVEVKYPPAPPPPVYTDPEPAPPATTKYSAVTVFSTTTPKVAFQAFVSVFTSCTATLGDTAGADNALAPPFVFIVTPDADKTILLVPSFTIVITEPIGKATDALVGIVMVCAPVLAE